MPVRLSLGAQLQIVATPDSNATHMYNHPPPRDAGSVALFERGTELSIAARVLRPRQKRHAAEENAPA